jgi:molybdate transport system substrate-binding protein
MIARLLVPALCLLLACGCGGDENDGAGAGSGVTPRLTVSAATSLKKAMTSYAERFSRADVRLSFAGSDELAAQIRQGVKPDVFAAANTKLPEELFAAKLVEKPAIFTANRLVLAVPAAAARRAVSSLDDLAEPGVTLAVGAKSVPVGAYTRTVLERLPAADRRAILRNVRSNEPDVGGVVGKLSQGAVDAGFAYATDVQGAGGKLTAIELPERLRPTVAYAVAVVKGAEQPAAARAFVAGLIDGPGQAALRNAGFEAPPAAR